MAWRKPKEGMTLSTKKKKKGSGGKMAHIFVVISYSHMSVLLSLLDKTFQKPLKKAVI